MFPIGMIISCPLWGYISDKILKSRKKVLLWGALLHTLCYIPLIFFNANIAHTMLYVLFFYYGLSGGAFVPGFACAKEIFAARFAGTVSGSLNIFLFTGGAFYQYIMGTLINLYPRLPSGAYSTAAYQTAFIMPFCGLLLGIVAFAFFKEEPNNL